MTLLAAALPTLCMASGLVPEQYYFGNFGSREALDRPLDNFQLSFDGGVQASSEARAYVTHDGAEVASSVSIEVKNYEGERRTQGWVWFFFSGECLPKGEEYTLHVAPGSIMSSDDKTVSNDEILVDFHIPEDIGEAHFEYYSNGQTIEGEDSFSCSWRHETSPVGEPEWELYREGVLVRRYPADVTSDWDLGQARVDFDGMMHFEQGVNYRLVLPAGSVCTYREDIMNTEVSLDFVGGYTEPVEYPAYHWCSLFDNTDGVVNEVSLYFRMPIKLTGENPMILTESFEGVESSWEAMPTLSEENGEWVLTADFGGVELKSGGSYTVYLTEGSVVSTEGDVAVNRSQSSQITTSGIGTVTDGVAGSQGTYALDGTRMDDGAKLPAGIYIMRDGISTRKIVVK